MGQDRQKALESLRKELIVSEIAGTVDQWVLSKRQGTKFVPVGMIRFENRRLVWASRLWGEYQDLFEGMSALHAATQNAIAASGPALRVNARTQTTPEVTVKTLEFKFSDVTVQAILVDSRDPGRRTMTVTEIYGD